jgi:hypothetical protein
MMHKIVFGLIVAVIVLGLVSCNKQEGGTSSSDSSGSSTVPARDTGITEQQAAKAGFELEAEYGKVTITGYTGSAKDVAIPGLIDGKPVTAIGDSAFSGNQLTSVTIPDDVKTIGDYAFEYNNLASVTIPDGVTSIGTQAFSQNQLTRITIPDDVDMQASSFYRLLYAHYAVSGRKADVYTFERSRDGDFETAVFNNAVEITGYTGSAKDVAVPARLGGLPVTAVGDAVRVKDKLYGSFAGNQLTSVTIPDGVTAIGAYAFSENQLTSVTIPDGVTAIGYGAFSQNRLTSVTIPDGVTTIGDGAFLQNQLTSVTIPDSVTTIGGAVFSQNRLTSVIIPDGVTSIGDEAFYQNQLTRVTIPDGVTVIGEGAFYQNQLTSVIIPNSVTIIGEGAFYQNQLISVTIPDGVTSIGYAAFYQNQLTSVTIGNGVTTIGEGAFWQNRLTRVTIGTNVNVTDDPFDGNLTDVYVRFSRRAGTYVTRDGDNRWSRQ